MGDQKISALTNGNPAQSGDLLPIDRSGANFAVSAGSIASLASPSVLSSFKNWKYWTSRGTNGVTSQTPFGWIIANFSTSDLGITQTATDPPGNQQKTQGSVDNTPATVYDASTTAIMSPGTLDTSLFGVKFSQTTQQTAWIGFTDALLGNPGTAMNSDTPAANVIGFIQSPTITNPTHWHAVCQTDASHQTLVDTGVVVDTNRHQFAILAGGGGFEFYIDGVLKATITTNVPAASTALQQFIYLMNHAVGQHDFIVYYLYQDTDAF